MKADWASTKSASPSRSRIGGRRRNSLSHNFIRVDPAEAVPAYPAFCRQLQRFACRGRTLFAAATIAYRQKYNNGTGSPDVSFAGYIAVRKQRERQERLQIGARAT